MPVKVNVGLSRKVSQDYNSRGFSLNVEAELPNDVVTNPDAFAKSTNELFQLANDLLDEQMANGRTPEQSSPPPTPELPTRSAQRIPPRDNKRQSQPANGRNGADGNGNGQTRGITDAQVRAITNMANRLNLDVNQWAESEYGVPVREMTLKQASTLIDILKRDIETPKSESVTR